ncbi:F-box/kelch-repeat protein At3g23880-like [Prosopis cineraria]|uniref:F-box/kelch-repeat protein At3g23880-like n=1 Tax=Prosopis cineraria TaxID=364024 RepID=UPI00240EDBC0|nr:F-box/kelch-repeat protein At3g23880-like [Prosopis cineraria]
MKHMRVDGDTPYLPEEIITNILKRLPVKSLIRFQCVCKHWKNLIQTPCFVADHVHHSTHQNPSLLFSCDYSRKPLRLLDCEMQVRQVQSTPLIDSFSSVRILGSSNGLLCLAGQQSDLSPSALLLWNPAIREVRQLPSTKTTITVKDSITVGFGFSPILNDYKIVRTYAESGYAISGVEVYSLSTNSWRKIEFGNLEAVRLLPYVVSVNGSIFWHALDLKKEVGEDSFEIIVSFDIAREVFKLIPWPALCCRTCFGISRLTVYEDKLAMLHSHGTEDIQYYLIDLWVWEEQVDSCGKRWNWSKKYASSPRPYMLYPESIWRNEIVGVGSGIYRPSLACIGDIFDTDLAMLSEEPKLGLHLFNVATNEIKRFDLHRHDVGGVVSNYVESLVSCDTWQHSR